MTDNLPASSAPKYIPIEDLLDYRKKGLTLEEIGTLTGITKQSVSKRLHNANLDGLERFSEHKDKVLEHKQHEIVNSLTDEKINSMSGLQAITAAAILEDKIRNIRQQSTGVISHQHLVIDLSKAIEAMRNEHSIANQGIEQSAQVIDITPCPSSGD